MKFFKELHEIKKYLPVDVSMQFDKLMLHHDEALRKLLRPVVGKPMLKKLSEDYEAGTLPSEGEKLMHLVRRPLGLMIGCIAFPALSVRVDGSGIRRQESEYEKSAFQYQELNLRNSWYQSAHYAVEELLEFLEENQDGSYFLPWKDSKYFFAARDLFVFNTDMVEEYVNIRQSRARYIQMRFAMKRIEERKVLNVLCRPLFKRLKTYVAKRMENDLRMPQRFILGEFIRPAVVHLSYAETLTRELLSFDEKGVFQVYTKSGTDNLKERSKAPINDVSVVMQFHEQKGNAYLRELEGYLKKNVSDFPLFEQSDCYKRPEKKCGKKIKPANKIVRF